MIKPVFLWSMCKTCPDSKWIGDVVRALGGQDVSLDFGQQQAFNAIKMDSDWMDERIDRERERHRKNMAAYRERAKAQAIPAPPPDPLVDHLTPVTEVTACDRHVIPSVPPSVPPSVHTPNGVSVSSPARPDVPSVEIVVSTAESIMGVPGWYARWWWHEMNARDWKKTGDGRIDHGNWRPNLKAWYERENPQHLAEIRDQYSKRPPEAVKVRPEDWQLCLERCRNCSGAGCRAGVKIPPPVYPGHPKPPEDCDFFAAIQPTDAHRTDKTAPQSAGRSRTVNHPPGPPKRPTGRILPLPGPIP